MFEAGQTRIVLDKRKENLDALDCHTPPPAGLSANGPQPCAPSPLSSM